MGDVFQDNGEIDVERNLLEERMKKAEVEELNKRFSGFSEVYAGLSIPPEEHMLNMSEETLTILGSITSQLKVDLRSIHSFLENNPNYMFRGKGQTVSSQTLATFIELCETVHSIINTLKTSYNKSAFKSEEERSDTFARYMKTLQTIGGVPKGSFDVFNDILKDVLEAKLVKVQSL